MDNYEGTLDAGAAPANQDRYRKILERYAASVPSSAYLGVAAGAMALALAFKLTGKDKWSNFITRWVPALLIIGAYNKVVKLEGHDQTDRGTNRGYSS